MGNLGSCFSPEKNASRLPSGSRRQAPGTGSRWIPARSKRKDSAEDALIQEQAMAAAILFRQYQNQQAEGRHGPAIERSTSLRKPTVSKKEAFPRSSSSRPRTNTDPLLQLHQLLNQDIKADDLGTNHFVLVHGGGFGAWCWYKTISLLQETGFRVSAIDLAGSGVDLSDPNRITSLSQYVKPLTDFIENLPAGEKVILVGHDFGGACIAFAMESFPEKVSKAVFIAAAMLTNGQSAASVFNGPESNGLMQQAQRFSYANGAGNPPTAIDLDKSSLRELLFNETQSRDVALASVSMRPVPFAPVLEKLRLSEANYGSLRRFYIETTEDNALPLAVQESMCSSSPPEKVFRLKYSDHSPFFSKPQALHKLLVEISKAPLPP